MDPILRLALMSAITRSSRKLDCILPQYSAQTTTRRHTPLRNLSTVERPRRNLGTVFAQEHLVVVDAVLGLRHPVDTISKVGLVGKWVDKVKQSGSKGVNKLAVPQVVFKKRLACSLNHPTHLDVRRKLGLHLEYTALRTILRLKLDFSSSHSE